MEQAQKRRSEKAREKDVESAEVKKDPKVEADKKAADDLLDAIDAILEENAETFVKAYVQQGGQ